MLFSLWSGKFIVNISCAGGLAFSKISGYFFGAFSDLIGDNKPLKTPSQLSHLAGGSIMGEGCQRKPWKDWQAHTFQILQ